MTQAGEEERTAAQLVAGGLSGESSGTSVLASSMRIKRCHQIWLSPQQEGVVTVMAALGHGSAGSGEATAS